MKFSICIPNYNYERYLGETLKSVLTQRADLEVLVSDNASTDRSVQVVESFKDPRIKVRVNAANVGFAGNLDRAARMATGDYIDMLSSDDLMRPPALEVYSRVLGAVEPNAVVASSVDQIDSSGAQTGSLGPDPLLWTEADLVSGLPVDPGVRVYRVEAKELLRRCLRSFRNPFHFLSAVYPRSLYEKIEGYGGGRVINPDKWFHWRLLTVASYAYHVDQPLYAYRWHATNQAAQQKSSGALKYLVDEYVSSFEADSTMLKLAGMSRDEFERAFVEYDVGRHGLATLAKGDLEKARRILLFGLSAYPKHASRNWKMWALGGLSVLPLGGTLAKWAYRGRGRSQ